MLDSSKIHFLLYNTLPQLLVKFYLLFYNHIFMILLKTVCKGNATDRSALTNGLLVNRVCIKKEKKFHF